MNLGRDHSGLKFGGLTFDSSFAGASPVHPQTRPCACPGSRLGSVLHRLRMHTQVRRMQLQRLLECRVGLLVLTQTKLAEADQVMPSGLARRRPRLVGLLPSGRGTPGPLRAGRLDLPPHPRRLRATLGQRARPAARTASLGTERTLAERGAQRRFAATVRPSGNAGRDVQLALTGHDRRRVLSRLPHGRGDRG